MKDIRKRKTAKPGRGTLIAVLTCAIILIGVCGALFIGGGREEFKLPVEQLRNMDIELSDLDTTPPEIDFADEVSLLQGSKYDLESAIESSVSDDFEVARLDISGEYDVDKAGKHDIDVSATDLAGNESGKTISIRIIDPGREDGDYEFTTDRGFKAERRDGVLTVGDIKIANKTFDVPRDYGSGLTKDTKAAFSDMVQAASSDGVRLRSISGYRSYSDQSALYNRYVRTRGQETADSFSAKPGHSEHHLGEAIDVNSLQYSFADTKEGKWLDEHCAEYGFIIRYPMERSEYTGYHGEPWHIRYVGHELAEELRNGGNWITLEEYFGLPSRYADE